MLEALEKSGSVSDDRQYDEGRNRPRDYDERTPGLRRQSDHQPVAFDPSEGIHLQSILKFSIPRLNHLRQIGLQLHLRAC